MRFNARLQLLGIPLVVLPLLAALGLFSLIVTRQVIANKNDLLATKLSLLENRAASSYDVLFKVGLQENEFFMQNARDAISRYFSGLLGPGEEFIIFSETGEFLSGSVDPIGRDLGADDPLRAALAETPGTLRLRSPFLSSPQDYYLVAHRFFAPWRWVLVVAGDESRVVEPLWGAAAASIALSLLFVLLSALGFILIARKVSQPLVRLTERVRGMGEGRLEPREEERKPPRRSLLGESDEVQVLSAEFESMAQRLLSLTRGLEARVAERTAELRGANDRLAAMNSELQESLIRVERMKDQLVQSEKLVALGQLVAGIAHELNTPLGAIGSAAASLDDAVLRTLRDLASAIDGLDRTQIQSALDMLDGFTSTYQREDRVAVRRQRDAIVAELAARGIPDADEGADLLVDCGIREVEAIPAVIQGARGGDLIAAVYELSVLKRSSSIIATASAQAVRVIEALRIYARRDDGTALSAVDLAPSIETVLTILQSKIRHHVEVNKDYAKVRPALANAEKLSQVWTNLVNNALQSMEYHGSLSIVIEDEGQFLRVDITDSGPGVPDELKDRIFTPFFTTKKPGEGSGLGLEICRAIVEGFGGSISFDSRPGRTTFSVRLPPAEEGIASPDGLTSPLSRGRDSSGP